MNPKSEPTLRELIFAVDFLGHFAGTNFHVGGLNKDFAGTNFRGRDPDSGTFLRFLNNLSKK